MQEIRWPEYDAVLSILLERLRGTTGLSAPLTWRRLALDAE